MAKVKIQGHASGTGVLTVTAPNTSTDRTITLPDSSGTILDSTSTLDATKLSGNLPALNASSLTNVPKDVTVGGRKNMIINGDFNIWQRGSSATAFTNSNTFLTDRFYSRNTGYGASTQEKSTDTPDGHSNSIKFVCTSAGGSFGAGDYVRMHQEIEGYNIVGTKFGTASAKSLTLSFWVKSSITGTNSIGIYNGAANKSFVSEYTVSSANTWEKKTISISAITSGTWSIDNTAELRLSFPMGSGSTYTTSTLDTWLDDFKFSSTNYIDTFGTLNATIQFAGVQLELGSTATDFEYRSYGEELALCQRYYQNVSKHIVLTGYQNGYSQILVTHNLCCPLRAAPSVSYEISTISAAQATSPDFNSYSITGLASYDWEFNSTVTSMSINLSSWNGNDDDACFIWANNDTTFDAEL